MSEVANNSNKRRRLSKELWLKFTLKKIGEVGVASVQIESLARDLRVTKGSFYWHFQDRDALLSESLSYWYDSATREIGRSGKRHFEDPLARLRYLFTLALSPRPDVPGGPVEQALREWARISQIAAETIRRVDQERISLIAEAYVELGMAERRARQTATMALAHLIGLNIVSRSKGERCSTDDTEAFLDIFLSRAKARGPAAAQSAGGPGEIAGSAG